MLNMTCQIMQEITEMMDNPKELKKLETNYQAVMKAMELKRAAEVTEMIREKKTASSR